MDRQSDEELLEHGWKHFEFHATQRLSLFNFYIVLCGLLMAAWATVMTSEADMSNVGIVLSLLLSFFSYVFWRMDQRNAHLTKQAESVLGLAEERAFGGASKLFCAQEIDESLGKPWNLIAKQWSHGTSLRVLFSCVGMIGLAGAVYSVLASSAPVLQSPGANIKIQLQKMEPSSSLSNVPPPSESPPSAKPRRRATRAAPVAAGSS